MIRSDFLFDDVGSVEQFAKKRVEQAQGKFKLYNMAPTSFKTYINAVGRAYNQVELVPFLLMSSTKQFPETTICMRAVCTRESTRRSIQGGSVLYDDHLLTEPELATQSHATDFT